ncbi:hypothetical protein NC652_016718 [Populus alba x Populus x berolinensis]|nr:hypothetical protein NC652_016718 [Populus alba x Populus x berolinensis]
MTTLDISYSIIQCRFVLHQNPKQPFFFQSPTSR